MVALVQRARAATVTVEGRVVARIEGGLLVLLGVHRTDTEKEAAWLARKVATLRIFADENGRMNRSVLDLAESDAASDVLVVSQFTLYGTLKKGTRPSYGEAAGPEVAQPLYERFVALLEAQLGRPVPTGVFGAHMDVTLINNGPVTLWLERRAKAS